MMSESREELDRCIQGLIAEYDALATQCDEGLAREAELREAFDVAKGMLQDRVTQCAELKQRLSEAEKTAAGVWRDGAPNHPWDSEHFLAEMVQGQFVVLRPLPEEYTYDFTTADGTYVMRKSIKRWAQLSDSQYIAPASPGCADGEKS